MTVATASVPLVPLSVKVSKVFGVLSASLMVSVPFDPAVAKVIVGTELESVNGLALENVLVLEKVLAWFK